MRKNRAVSLNEPTFTALGWIGNTDLEEKKRGKITESKGLALQN